MNFNVKSVYLFVWLMSVIHLSHSVSLHVEESNTLLPTGIAYSTAVYDGLDTIYILGGSDIGGTKSAAGVFKYSISTDTVEKIGNKGDIRGGSGVWTGVNEILYFGHDWEEGYSGIWRIDPTDLNSLRSVHNLTNQMTSNVVVWDNEEYMYSFSGSFSRAETYKYSKRTNSLTEFNNLPTGRLEASAVWDDVQNKAYIFGGVSSFWEDLDDILEFDPVTNTATKLNISLTRKARGSCAVWTGIRAYILGGYPEDSSSRFTPSTETVEPIALDILYSLYSHSCVWIEKLNRLYIFGGDHGNPHQNQISYIDLPEEEIPTTPFSEGPTLCKGEENGVLLADPECCRSFFLCFDQLPLTQNCPSPLQFHPMLKKCEDKAIVNCGNY